MRRAYLLITLLAGITCPWNRTAAQEGFRCGTDQARAEALVRDPHLLQRESALEEFIQAWIAEHRDARDLDTTVLTIPLVFHILHMDGPENISREQILDAVAVLNRDYRLLNEDIGQVVPGYEGIAGDIRLQFKLATIDPLGNCTDGIDRVRTVETFIGDNGSKMRFWPRNKYVNIWTVSRIESGAAGYSQYPSAMDGAAGTADGVMILHDYVGRIGTSEEGHSRALTHEIGHFLDLQHVWGDSNGEEGAPEGNMSAICGDDLVFDTPRTKGHSNCLNRFDITCGAIVVDSIYSFDQVTNSSGMDDPRGAIALGDTVLGDTMAWLSGFHAQGVSANSLLPGKFAFGAWADGATEGDTAVTQMEGVLDPAKYYEFTISPTLLHAATLTGVRFIAGRSLSGPRTFAVRVSTNNFSSNVVGSIVPANTALTVTPGNIFFFADDLASEVPGVTINLSGAQFTQTMNPITFRLYGWNSEDAFGSFNVDNVQLLGSTGVIENVENYMEYSYCSKMFTYGQMLRMRAALASDVADRNQLYTPTNRSATGTDGFSDQACAPQAGFTWYDQAVTGVPAANTPSGTRFYCIGDEVHFFDNSMNGEPTSWSWTFQDGTPATSNERNPVVTFNTSGYKNVYLLVSNQYGSSAYAAQTVSIAWPYAELPGAISESFENEATFPMYYAENYEGNATTWTRVTGTGFNSNACVKMNGFNTYGINDYFIDDGANDIDALITPTMDLTWLVGGELTFRYAYATNTTDIDEVTEALEVWSSTNCGRTWQRREVIEGVELITDGATASAYVPTSPDVWRFKAIDLPPSLLNDQVRFKFLYRSSGASNNIYVDDINITGSVGMEDMAGGTPGLSIAPNPTNGQVTIGFAQPTAESGLLAITDAQGRTVWQQRTPAVAHGRMELDARALGLGAGVYVVRLNNSGGQRMARLVVN